MSGITGIIIVSHGKLCEELITSAEMLHGIQERLVAVPLLEGMSPGDYSAILESRLDEMGEDTLILIDLFGGTPCNTVLSLSRNRELYAVAGVNMPMLLEACVLRMEYKGRELAEMVASAAGTTVTDISDKLAAFYEKYRA